jgi:hypothetical protein
VSTRQKFAFLASTHQNGRFQKYVRLARLADIRQAVLRGLARFARFADIRQPVLLGLAKLAKFANLFWSDSPDSPKFAKGHF